MSDPIKDLERLVAAHASQRCSIHGNKITCEVSEGQFNHTLIDLPALLAHVKAMEKVCEAAKVLASKAERKKGTTAQWIVWNSELTPLDEALSHYTKGQADAK